MSGSGMGHGMASGRIGFSRADFEFLACALAGAGERRHLSVLWEGPESLRAMLDLKTVLRAVLEGTSTLSVTPSFYFYVLVRHSFLESGLEDVTMADYVSGVLAERVAPDPDDLLGTLGAGLTHAADFVSILETSRGRLRFHLEVAAGNQFLVLTGMYPEFLRKRAPLRWRAGFGFYESFASRAFRTAADHACHPGGAQGFGGAIRRVSADSEGAQPMTEEFVFLGD